MKVRRSKLVGCAPGFTIIEILVVMAIIVLMAAILIPSLRAAREQARVTVCLTNLHDTGTALHEYTVMYDPYYPLKAYIGCSIYTYDRTPADDNLFVLWLKKLCPDVNTFTCPSTTHKIRKPIKIERVRVNAPYLKDGFGIRYDIYCDPKRPNVIRNDWEYHGQLVSERYEVPYDGTQSVEGFGTSYEYMGWSSHPTRTTKITWYPFPNLAKVGREIPGEPLTVQNMKFPAGTALMKDADEGGKIAGAPTTAIVHGNVPEPWDNHGAARANFLYGDGHVATKWWDKKRNDWAR